MASNRASVTVAGLEAEGALLVQDGNHGAQRPRSHEKVPSGIPHIRAADIRVDGSIDFEAAEQLADSAWDRISKGRGRAGDVLLTHKGTVGRVARAPANAPTFLCSPQTTFWRSLRRDVLDQQFLHCLLRSPGFAAQMKRLMHESDMAPYVSLTSQRGLVLQLPPVREQRAIATTLGALDDKIGSNRRLGATCHAVVLAEFAHRFGGDWPGAGTQANRVADGQWGRLGDVIGLRYGKALKASERVEGAIAVVGSSGVVGSHNRALVDGPAVVVGRKGVAGSVIWVDEDAWPIDTTFYAVPLGGRPLSWVYGAVLAARLTDASGDSAVPGLNRETALARNALVPSRAACAAFDDFAAPLLAKRAGTAAESRTLTAIRDALLPKLVSGQIRVPLSDDPEEQIATATDSLAATRESASPIH